MRAFIVKSSAVKIQGCRSMGSLSFSKFGNVSDVLSLSSAKTESSSPAAGQLKIALKASQVLSEDIRSIRGLSFTNKNVGVAGTTAVGVVTGVANGESDFAVNDSVLVVGNGLWADEATVSKTNVSKLSKATSEDSATLPTLLSAWGILNNSVKLSQGDVVLQSSGDSATGAAISQIGKALGYTVISPSSAELADPKFVANTKAAHKSVKLAITDRSGKIALDLARTVSNNGSMVFYNGHIESVEQSVGVDIPAASTIYKGVSIVGFDLGAWHAADRAGFEKGVAAVQALSSDKKVSVKSKVFPVADFKKAVADVEATNSAAVIKF